MSQQRVHGLPPREELAANTSPEPRRFGMSNREAPSARKHRVCPFPAKSCRSSISEVFAAEKKRKKRTRRA